MLLYLRHGRTEDLDAGIRSRPDTPLTTTGRQEARTAARRLLELGIMPDLLVCSELLRAAQTSNEVVAGLGRNIKVTVSRLLIERDWGKATGVDNVVVERQWPGGFNTVPGAETDEQLQQRAALAADFLKSLRGTVLVVGHGTVGRALIRVFEGRPASDELNSESGKIGTGQIVRLSPSPTTFL